VKILLSVVFTFVLSLYLLPARAQSEWKLEKSSKGVSVLTRQIEESTIKEFKAEVVIKANIKRLKKVIANVEQHPDWMYGLKSAHVLNGDPKILQYIRSAPFPFTDRYVVMLSETVNTADTCRITLEHLDHPGTEDTDGLVEIEFIKGTWLLIKLDDSSTSVTYQFVADPGGNLPDWLVNSFIVKTPFVTLKNLREMMEE
jgi:uncharacterized membrane protein